MGITDFAPPLGRRRSRFQQGPPYVVLRIGDLPALPDLDDVSHRLRALLPGRRPTRAERARDVATHPAALYVAGFATGIAIVLIAGSRTRAFRRVFRRAQRDAALHAERVNQLDDTELAHKVESIVFRHPGLPKGSVNINAENGRVFLRGQVDTPDAAARLERAVRDVDGVKDVENLLHLPGTPAPHADDHGALLPNSN
jgi:BON domain-containing protein